MKIYELEEGTEVTLVVLYDEKTLNLKSTCVGAKGKDLLIAALRVDGKVLNLGMNDVKVNVMMDRENEKPLMWTACEVKMVVVKGTPLMKVSTKFDGQPVNRREDFRLYIGGAAKGRIGRNKEALQMVLRDVSYSGFAVFLEGKVQCEIGNPIRVVHKDAELMAMLDLQGKIVRMEERNDRLLLGCKLDLPSAVLGKYISDKQQKILSQRTSGS